MRLFTLFFSLLFLSLPGVLSFAPTASAQQQTKLSVSPVTFDFTANPGDTITNQIKVSNSSDAPLQLEVRVENIEGTGEQGQVKLTEEDTSFSLRDWVQTNPSRFSLESGKTQVVAFTVTVPKNAEPGGHYGSILIGTVASNGVGASGSAIVQRIGSLILIKVSGETKEDLVITGFQPKTFVGTWDETTDKDGNTKILVAKDEKLEQEKTLRYFNRGPIAFDVEFRSNGNVHVKPTGFVTIYDLFNRKVAELPIDERNVFPGSDRRVTVIWPQKKLWGVYYRAQLVVIYGDDARQTISSSTAFWAFPLAAAMAIGVVVVGIFLLRQRLGKALRILIRGT